MSVTNKQAAARLVKNLLQKTEAAVDTLMVSEVTSAAEKSRLSEKMVTEIKDYAKAFLKPSCERVEHIISKIAPAEEVKAEAK